MAFELEEKHVKLAEDTVLLSEETIRHKVKELGKTISKEYLHKCPILVGVLNGSFVFCADLCRELSIECEIDFIKISSYGKSQETSGKIKLLKNVDADITDRHVLVVEDIVDSGYSLSFLRKKISELKPKSLRIVSLLVKDKAARTPYEVDYIGFVIPNRFVVGYGLDYAQKYRNLRDIYVVD